MSSIVKRLEEMALGVKLAITLNHTTFSFKLKTEEMNRNLSWRNNCRHNLRSCTAPTYDTMISGPHTSCKSYCRQWTIHIIQHQYLQ